MSFRAGDWNCEQCGDHQFERNLSCRKCGAPKQELHQHQHQQQHQHQHQQQHQHQHQQQCGAPMVASNRQIGKAGDWICPNPECQDLQFERNAVCRRCSTPKPGGMMAARGAAPMPAAAPGALTPVRRTLCRTGIAAAPSAGGKGMLDGLADSDWTCDHCGDHQFARNIMCRKCGAPKPTTSSNNQVAKVGDWICPNHSCQDVQFERNRECRKCGTPKPGGAARRQESQTEAGLGNEEDDGSYIPVAENWDCQDCGNTQPGKELACYRCGAPRPQTSSNRQIAKKGDWICPSCQDVQFEKNAVCRKCSTPKPGGIADSGFPQPERQQPSVGNVAPDDWLCAQCGDHQFARNLQCRKCAAPRPQVSDNNQAAKKGDWICPNRQCGDVQFERNQVCRRCGMPKPMPAGKGGVSSVYQRPAALMVDPYQMNGKGAFGVPAAAMPMYAASRQPVVASNRQMCKPGDWICPNPACQDVQFERNARCRKCGADKPVVSSNRQIFKRGDWICPNLDCKDVQFERNQECRKCGTAKPAQDDGEAERSRSRSPVLR